MECSHRFAVLGGDTRLTWLVRSLQQRGRPVRTFAVPDCADTYETMELTLLNTDCVILPIPAFRDGFLGGAADRKITLAQLAPYLHPGMTVFGGKLGELLPALQQTGARAVDYGTLEQFAAANAVPTAEGAIQIAMEQTPHTVQDAACLVVGYGRIGKLLAYKLRALGARVTVSARSEKELALLPALGYEADVTGRYRLPLDRYDVVFNTVPARIFDGAQLAAIRPDALLIDLSSSPGGIDWALCKALPRRAVPGWLLPGKVAPATAGRILCDTVLAQLPIL